jgi:biotin carboxylase
MVPQISDTLAAPYLRALGGRGQQLKRVILLNTTKERPVQILAADRGVQFTVITEPRYFSLYEPLAQVGLVDDIEDLPSVRDAVLQSCPDGNIDYIVSATERTLQAGGYLRSLLGLPGISFEVANTMSNKYAMKLVLSEAGLPVAPFRRLLHLRHLPWACRDMKWPLVVKPVMGTGAMNTFVVGTGDDFALLYDSPSSAALRGMRIPLIAESLVEFEWEFHSEGIAYDGELIFSSAGRYFGSLLENMGKVNGSYMLSPADPEWRAITELHRKTVAAIGLRSGVTHLQGFRTTAGHVVGEITCRPAGGAIPDLVKAQYHVDLWRAFLDVSLGERPAKDGDEQNATFARCWIPPVPGIVQSLATRAELECVPWVVSADVRARVGERIGPAVDSSSHVAMVIYHAATPEEAVARANEVVARVNFKAF